MYPDQVRLVYRHFPLSFHDKAMIASQAAEAAGLQGKFFEMSSMIYDYAFEWNDITPDEFEEWVSAKIVDLDLDVEKFNQDWNSPEVIQRVESDMAEGRQAGVGGTPTVYINGALYSGARSVEVFSAILQLMGLIDQQFTDCPPMVIDPAKNYTATLETDKGDIVIQLYADKAPLAVNSFVFLAREGWFDNVIFHRVIPGFVAQTGDPLGMGFGGPGYAFDNEISSDLQYDSAGVVGMANSGPNLNGSQFFITYDAIPDLDGGYTIFGKVIQGMDVAESLTPRDPSQAGDLPPGDKIIKVTISEE
jgi:cyclophilin family peptidyl-prolyl cis-trans isomerase